MTVSESADDYPHLVAILNRLAGDRMRRRHPVDSTAPQGGKAR